MPFASDAVTTKGRFALLQDYMAEHVLSLNGSFLCSSEKDCRFSALVNRITGQCRTDRHFATGQLSHVGFNYDLTEDGRPLRILAIPMDTGRANERVTLEMRRGEVAASARLLYRERNPHMKGTTHALRLAIGREVGTDTRGEVLDILKETAPVHLFDCYAMANLRLCSATDEGSTESRGTVTMSRNCLRHLKATIEILEPTLCIVQGVKVADAIAPIVERRETVTEHLDWVRVAGVETLLAAFTHPSAKNVDQNWSRITNAPYLWDVVRPTIRAARRELGLAAVAN